MNSDHRVTGSSPAGCRLGSPLTVCGPAQSSISQLAWYHEDEKKTLNQYLGPIDTLTRLDEIAGNEHDTCSECFTDPSGTTLAILLASHLRYSAGEHLRPKKSCPIQ